MKTPISRHFLSLFSLLLAAMVLSPHPLHAEDTPIDSTLVSTIDTTWASEIPVIELTYDASAFNSKTFIPAEFTYHDSDTVRQYRCTIRRRGGTSLKLDKPNYAIKFYKEDGESRDVRFMGLRKDNNWILDAMASDYSKMRNRVSMDLWLDFSSTPYHLEQEPKAINGYRGGYVEVYANGDYSGLFCLMERLDRKQLKLSKFAVNESDSSLFYRGVMYKAVNGSSTRTPYFYWQQNEPNDTRSSYDGMQCEYPDVSAGEPWSWIPLRNAIYFLAAYSNRSFYNGIGKRFDLPVFNDFILFVDLLYATDNIGKNYYCWIYDHTASDKRLGITPWDLDTTWGRNYLSARVSARSELGSKTNYFIRMSAHYTDFDSIMSARYGELRDSLWTEESLCGYFDRYFDLFERTGAWERDFNRWDAFNCRVTSLDSERDYLHQWIHDRLLFLDEYYGYVPPSAIRQIQDEHRTPPFPDVDLFGRPVRSGSRGFLLNQGHLIYHP